MKKSEFVVRLYRHNHQHLCALEGLSEVIFPLLAQHAASLPMVQGLVFVGQVDGVLRAMKDASVEDVVYVLNDLIGLVPEEVWDALHHEELLEDIELSPVAYHAKEMALDVLVEAVSAGGYQPDLRGYVVPPEITSIFRILGEAQGMTETEIKKRLNSVAKKLGVAFEGV